MDFTRPGTQHEQIAEGHASRRKLLLERIKSAKEAIAACSIICGASLVGARYIVRQAVRDELSQMRQIAEDARVQASGVARIREDLTSLSLEEAKRSGEILGKINALGGTDMALRQEIASLQERIDRYLTRSPR